MPETEKRGISPGRREYDLTFAEHQQLCDRNNKMLRNEMCLKINTVKEDYAQCHVDVETMKKEKADKAMLTGSFKLLWGILILLLVSLVINGGYSYSQNQGMQSTNAQQDTEIEHLEQGQDKLEEKFTAHMLEQRQVNEKILEGLNSLKTDLTVIKQKVQ